MPDMDPAQLMKIAGHFRLSQAIYTAAALGVADQLLDGSRSSAELAAAVGADADLLRRLMRALSSEGVFNESEDGTFGLAPAGRLLVSGGGVREVILGWAIFQPLYRAFEMLPDSVRTGRNAFELSHHSEFFPYLAENPSVSQVFEAAMVELVGEFERVAASYDFGDVETLVDLGGGNGSFLSVILQGNPEMRAIMFDLPAVISGIRPGRIPADADARITRIAGDFLRDPLPRGDAHMLATVLRLFDDDLAKQILRNVREAMSEGGKVLVVDMVHPPGPLVQPYGLADLSAMVLYGGRDRSAAEFADLFAASGLRLSRIIDTGVLHKWVEAVAG